LKSALVDAVLREATAAQRVPGVVGAVTDQRGVVYHGAFGYSDAAARRPMTPDAVFRIASMTKIVTTLAVMQLVEAGRVAVDAPCKRFLPEYRQPPVLERFDAASRRYTASPADRDVTVRDLLTHTSGYGYWFLNPELHALMGTRPEHFNPPFLVCEPGSRFQYGTSTDVLGCMIGPASGAPLEAYFAERVLGPLGMRDTGFDLPTACERLVALHVPDAGGSWQPLPNETAGEAPRGGGGLVSTVDDYLALVRLFLNAGRVGTRQLLGRESLAAVARHQLGSLKPLRQTTAVPARSADFGFMDGTQEFGFGVLIETAAQPGRRSAGSYGWGGLFNTYFWVDPAAGIGGVLCMQLSPFCAPPCLALYAAFERAVYRALGLSA
jgi:methyl acetate hydrolase